MISSLFAAVLSLFRPKRQYIHGVMVFFEGAARNWPGLEETLLALYGHGVDSVVPKCVLYVYPESATLGPNGETGLTHKTGDKYVISVRRLGTKPAYLSALPHEFAEHVVPHSRGEGWNKDHSRPDLTTVGWQIAGKARALHSQKV